MIARSSTLIHPSGLEIETPLLIPSFSSKGFAFKNRKKRKGNDISEVADVLEFSKEFLTETLLVSAYDLHYQHIPYEEGNFVTPITIIDSGGYEAGSTYDLSTTTKYNYDVKPWSEQLLEGILNAWPEYKSAIIVSYDDGNYRTTLSEQIKNARNLFSKYPHMLNNFLIKPEAKTKDFISVNNVVSEIDELKYFNVIGVTERELGNSLLKRMIAINKIREAMDAQKISSPIHVFGSLDPITSILYFLAGAEIFDGLTWLKYSYLNNSAIYTSNYGILEDKLGISINDRQIRYNSFSRNIYYLESMKQGMKEFLHTKDFKEFDKLGDKRFGAIIEKCFNRFISNL